MSSRCPRCPEAELPDDSRFCCLCGLRLGTEAPAAGAAPDPYTPEHLDWLSSSPREGERKRVAVLLADVAGSLSMAHCLEPEDVHAVMDGFFALALDAVHAEQGTINQFRGDGFMALFGAPRARGHEALRAVRAALSLRQATEGYSRAVRERFGVSFVVRTGIHAGLVWVGPIGKTLRLDYTAEGPTVGLAARLEEAAQPGEILVSGEVAERVKEYVGLRCHGESSLRGVPEPVAVHAVTGAGEAETRLDVERARGLSPFVGRRRELEGVASRLAAVGPGQALWLEVRGEAGCGKSRLALEVRERSGWRWLEARCREADGSRAYAAWIDLLGRWGQQGIGAEAAEKPLRLARGEEGARSPESVAAAIRDLMGESFGAGPASILFEDTQWIDPSSRRVLEHLLRAPPGGGLRLLATSRGEGGVAWPADLPVQRVDLGALDEVASSELATGLLGSQASEEPLVALVTERSGGNPLFVEELARALREGPEPVREAARLEVAWKRSPVRIPTTLEEVIEARIDALPEPAKRLLQTIAVVARPLDAELLEAIDSEAGPELGSLLDSLVQRELLVRLFQGLDFRHVMFRDVAYRQIVRDRRQRIHGRCAAVLAARPGARTAAAASEIALHYDRAGEPAHAVPYFAEAGHAYLALTASEEAVAHLRRAWEILTNLDPADASLRVGVGLDLANALNSLDRSGEAAAVLHALAPAELETQDRLRVAVACISSGWVTYSEAGDVAAARRSLDRGIDLTDESPEGLRIRATGHAYRLRVEHMDGEIERAVASARRVSELATAGGDRFGLVLGKSNEGCIRCDAGEVERAASLCREAARLAEDARHELGIAISQGWLAKALCHRGEAGPALCAADRAGQIGERLGQVGVLFQAEIWRGEVHLLQGDPRSAAEAFARLAEINDRWPTTLDQGARGALELGRFDEAIEQAERCLAAEPPRLVRARALRTLGLAIGLSRPAEAERAEALLGQSLSLCDDLGLRPLAAHACAGLGELWLARGRGERAAYYGDRAVRDWEACGMPVHARAGRRMLAGD